MMSRHTLYVLASRHDEYTGLTKAQKQILDNLSNVLEAAGTSMENVVKVNIFLADTKDFAAVNEVYVNYFGDVMPARS